MPIEEDISWQRLRCESSVGIYAQMPAFLIRPDADDILIFRCAAATKLRKERKDAHCRNDSSD